MIDVTEIHLLSSKYKDFDLEIARMWKRKTETKPVVGDLRLIKKGLKKYVERILAIEKSRIVDASALIL